MASTSTPASFAATSYDYLIAGGGTAGLTLAARLSEDPRVAVGVIEAGLDRTQDPNVLTPGFAVVMWENPDYDWIFKTTPQKHGNDRVVAHPRGKQLGGSSAINFDYWTHASQRDIDDWYGYPTFFTLSMPLALVSNDGLDVKERLSPHTKEKGILCFLP